MVIELTDNEQRRLADLVRAELDAIKRYQRDTPEMHEGIHALYRNSHRALASVASKLTKGA